MTSLRVVNCGGALVEGPDGHLRVEPHSEVHSRDGVITHVGEVAEHQPAADTTVDAGGLLAVPALIDGHVHPVVGGVSVVPPASDWLDTYLGAGVTQCVSAGELTMPGVRAATLDPAFVTGLAVTAATLFRHHDSPLRVHAGTLLAVPGLTRSHLAAVRDAGGRCLKFIYYPFEGNWEPEVRAYAEWAHELGLTVKMHAGGTSFRGHSVSATADLVARLQPDVLGHANGGPIPMSDEDIQYVIEKTDCALEVILGGNLRLLAMIAQSLRERGQLRRLVIGTDTPGGNGLMPRGVLQVVAAVASLGGLTAWEAWRCASVGVAEHHGIQSGQLAPGGLADFLLVGPIGGSSLATTDAALESGEIIGAGAVVAAGRLVRLPGPYLPPPLRTARIIAGP